jgi:uncharacterized protein YciI
MRNVWIDQSSDEVGRVTAIFFGLALLFGAFVLGALGLFVLFGQETRPGLGAGILGVAVLYGAWYVLVMSWKLLFNRPRREGRLLSPPKRRIRMKSFGPCLVLALAAIASTVSAQTAPEVQPEVKKPAVEYSKANPQKIGAYIVLLRLRYDIYGKWRDTGKWPSNPESDKALEGHSAYWDDQLKHGRAILAAAMSGDYWDNAAFIIFEASSLEEAQKIAAGDPAVKTYNFQAQVRPLDVFWISNKYTTPPAK